MSSPEDQKPVPVTEPPAVEYKKDGTVSRRRAHSGNVPQLPQTKLCPFCPAKFTRTTHLNRHLRNHTNERLYRCETCTAQFTRSDLLARHKRSCGESRSRRRSCQACAGLKVKCDLQQPCAKCQSRGRECVYTSEQEVAEASSRGTRAPGPSGVSRMDASAGFAPSSFSLQSREFASAFPELSLIEEANDAITQPLSEANMASFVEMQASGSRMPQAMSLPTHDVVSNSNTVSSFRPMQNRAFTAYGASDRAGPAGGRNLSSFSSNMFEPFFRDVFAESKESPEDASPATENAPPPMMAGSALEALILPEFSGVDDAFMMNGSLDLQPFMAELDSDLMYDMITNTYPEPAKPEPEPEPAVVPAAREYAPPYPGLGPATKASPYTQEEVAQKVLIPPSLPVDPAPPEPTTEELQQYLYVFLTAFLPQIPIIHTPSLRVELKPPILLRAMQACGALFVKTRTAEAFVERTLSTSRELLVHDFAKPSPDPKHQVHITMTLILLQTIGLFHQDPQQRAASNIYHGMLVLMIRQNRIIERSTTWIPKTFPTMDSVVLEETWRDWAVHEAIKRAVCLAYVHDQSHRIYFSLPASFQPQEFSLYLPCDDALWTAPTAYAWSQVLTTPSPYGSISERMSGVPMPRALSAVGIEGPSMTATTTSMPPPPHDVGQVSPFGHFVLVHALLGELFRRCSGTESPAPSPAPDGEEGEQVNEHVFAIQLALHRWLQLWLKSPESARAKPQTGPAGIPVPAKDTPFMADPLPFYWLAQLLLLAFQESLPPFRPLTPPVQSSPSAATSPSSSASSPFAPSPFTSFTSSSSSSMSPPFTSTSSSSSRLSPPPAYTAGLPMPTGEYYARSQTQPDTATAQFSLIRGWLHHIRMFLKRSQGSPTVVWDELMKIRLRGWYADALPESRKANTEGGDYADPGESGLLGFFEEKLKL
ncbi:hypothetical protein BV25DRAFT_1815158 [Artomyces pyxidatus]|uniref:Uncharacterized protein n=1 Tax=Artomyces pyxidatus TaxID=48021 RepID=A0ACB8SGT5_9AGAM|nr:hypothetical protein BV25DRAFT_1815158 [Artomyces pyxidatus]